MTREAYVKYTWTIKGLEVIVGLEWRRADNPRALHADLKRLIADELSHTSARSAETLSFVVEHTVLHHFPDRAYFVEVRDEDDIEVQVYDPRGFLKTRCDCPCRQPACGAHYVTGGRRLDCKACQEAMARETSKYMVVGAGDS